MNKTKTGLGLVLGVFLLTGCTMADLFGEVRLVSFDGDSPEARARAEANLPSMVIPMKRALPLIRRAAQRKEYGRRHAMLLGDIELSRGNLAQAETAFILAVGHEPNHVPARIRLADARVKRNHHLKAALTYRDALTIKPMHHKATRRLSMLLERDRPKGRAAPATAVARKRPAGTGTPEPLAEPVRSLEAGYRPKAAVKD